MNTQIICLIGKSATGKSSIEKKLLKTGLYHSVVTMTTRPRRPGEVDGQDYYFVNDFTYDDLVGRGLVYCQTEYIVDGERYRYGFTKDSLSEEKPNLLVLNPVGLKELVDNPEFKNNLFVFYVVSSLSNRIKRYLNREGLMDDSIYKRLTDRLLQDEKDFDDIVYYCNKHGVAAWACQNDTADDLDYVVETVRQMTD